ncbi:hypothetical protein ABEF95_009402 [Exophiala dermatitidis]
MGRHHHPHLPEHLYISRNLSPPGPSSSQSQSQHQPHSVPSTSSFLSVKSVLYHPSPAALLQETGRTTALAVGDRIPGFKTSAAFFNTLRANLILDADSAPPSLSNTPDSLRPVTMASSNSLPPPSPSALAQTPESAAAVTDAQQNSHSSPLDSIPELKTTLAVTEDDKVEALHLLADSVAQQRQIASTAVLFHPATLSLLVLLFGLVYHHFYKGSTGDLLLVGTTSTGVLMAVLVTIRWLVGGYLVEAERIGTWKWLNLGREDGNSVGDEDEILLTRFGDEVIGTLILRGQRENGSGSGSDGTTTNNSTSPTKRSSRKTHHQQPVHGVIRGWTVKQRYRRKGVGQGLLEEAVQLCQTKGWAGPDFATDHANSHRVLPAAFNGGFAKRERLARDMLERVKQDSSGSSVVANSKSASASSSGGGRNRKR